MIRPLLVLTAALLVAFCLEDFETFCHNLVCPHYKLTDKNEKFEVRFYEATKWISTKIEGDSPTEITAAYRRLKDFCDKNGETGHNISNTLPHLIYQVENTFFLQWFVPPGTTLPAEVPPSITVVLRPAATFYVRFFGGMPSLESGYSNAGCLIDNLKEDQKSYNESYFIGAGYEGVFSLTHHNEIWISAA